MQKTFHGALHNCKFRENWEKHKEIFHTTIPELNQRILREFLDNLDGIAGQCPGGNVEKIEGEKLNIGNIDPQKREGIKKKEGKISSCFSSLYINDFPGTYLC